MSGRMIVGDCREILPTLGEGTVQTCITSPPYWGLRDYGVGEQLGLERTPEEYVAKMVAVFREVRRVLRDDGTLWLNLGDSYAGSGKGGDYGNSPKQATSRGSIGVSARVNAVTNHALRLAGHGGYKPKDMVGIPWMVAFALRADGWYLRQDIIWHKPNPMPESVTDRCTKAHEYIFLLSVSRDYYWDQMAMREPAAEPERDRVDRIGGANGHEVRHSPGAIVGRSLTRNRRSVWTIQPQPYRGAHFATFPEALVVPCVLAGSRVGDTVLDPFFGTGTVGAVAERHGRNWVGIDISAEYAKLQQERTAQRGLLCD